MLVAGDDMSTPQAEGRRAVSLAYKVEELLALRDSVSESAVSIDKFADEDVIKEHVLRPSVSACLVAARQPKQSTTPSIVVPTVNKKPSPSPSIKRGKAEKLLKEHGSPPGMRVTAGGRIVPSDLPPLGSARFASNGYRPPPPSSVLSGMSTMTPQPDAASQVEIIGNQPVIRVGDRLFALPSISTEAALPVQAPSPLDRKPSLTGLDLSELKARQNLRKQELRSVEQTEVLQSSHQTQEWRDSMIKKKRSLILELDELRKRINTLEAGAYTAPPALQSGFMPFQQPHPMFPGMPLAMPSPDPYLMMFPGFGAPGMVHGESSHYGTAGPTTFAPRGPASPGSASRRSHAIEIKPPPDEPRKLHVLDPKSPTYEPGMKVSTNLPVAAPPTPSPAKRSTEYSNRVISQNPSLSSIDTTDFFPTNTHEHSTTRVAPNTMMLASQQSSRINVAPETPEKWPNDPWNPPPSNEAKSSSAKRLSSWTGELGKRRSGGQQSSSESPAYPQGLVERHQAEHKALNYRDDSLAPASQQTISSYAPGSAQHGLITFQEGYQAGYEHRNLPANVEYLRGFAEGLAASLNEQKLVAQFTRSQRERDSAVAMEFPESANLENTEVRFRPFSMNPNMADSFHKHTSIRQFSGNQLQTRASPAPSQRYFPKESPLYAADVTMYKVRSAGDRQRMSGLDGAMDDLAELIEETKLTEQDAESAEEASCFKTSGKGKQKASSPNKAAATPTEQPSSPKKSSEHSPAKAKLEKVTNKLRRNNKKEDPQTMSPDEKRSRTEKWRGRFRSLREQENKEIEEYMRNNPRGGCNNPRGGYK